MAQSYSIGDLAREFEVTTRTIRHYEDEGMNAPRREGQRRIYGPRDRVRLQLILRGRRFGFSLEEIRQWLELYETQGTELQYSTFIDMANRQLGALTKQREELDRTIAELEKLRDETGDSLSKLSS